MAGPLDALGGFLDIPLLGGPLTVGRLILFFMLTLIGLMLADILSKWISIYFFRTWGRKGDDPESRRLSTLGRTALTTYIRWTIFITFLLLSTNVLGVKMAERYSLGEATITPGGLINILVMAFAIVLFIQLAMSPLCRFFIHILLKGHVDRREEFRLYKLVLRPLKSLLIVLLLSEALRIEFGGRLPYIGLFGPILILAGYLLAALFAAAVLIVYLRRAKIYLEPKTKYAPSPVEKLVKYIAILVALGVAMVSQGVDIVAVAASLGLIGFALAFGLQDTIANLAAGIMIAVDKPFTIGDRIKIGDKWGDVVDIGLRSTRVATPDGELVIVPNQLVGTQEVWNYTHGIPRLRDSVAVSISFGSDVSLVEKILLETAAAHPHVIKNPMAFARVEEFGESGINMKLWYWIRDARDMRQVRADLLRDIKIRFDEGGVEIPYPYRTVVYKTDLPRERKLSERDFTTVKNYSSLGQIIIPPGAVEPSSTTDGNLLIPLGVVPFSQMDLPVLFKLAEHLEKEIDLVYLYGPRREPARQSLLTAVDPKPSKGKGADIIDDIVQKGREAGIRISGIEKAGQVEKVLLKAIEETTPSAVVFTFPQEMLQKATGKNLIALVEGSGVPVILLYTGIINA